MDYICRILRSGWISREHETSSFYWGGKTTVSLGILQEKTKNFIPPYQEGITDDLFVILA